MAMTEERMAYSASEEYSPYSIIPEIAEAQKLISESKFNEALYQAELGLKKDMLNVDLLVIKAATLREMGSTEEADAARQQWIAVVDSILLSGDGKDYATAFKVISVAEEYAVLNVKNFQMLKQSNPNHEGSEFDILTVKDKKTGEESVIYFNIDLPKKRLKKKTDGDNP
jgi:hypothetical protein